MSNFYNDRIDINPATRFILTQKHEISILSTRMHVINQMFILSITRLLIGLRFQPLIYRDISIS